MAAVTRFSPRSIALFRREPAPSVSDSQITRFLPKRRRVLRSIAVEAKICDRVDRNVIVRRTKGWEWAVKNSFSSARQPTGGVSSRDHVVGSLFGICAYDAAETEEVELALTGVFALPGGQRPDYRRHQSLVDHCGRPL